MAFKMTYVLIDTMLKSMDERLKDPSEIKAEDVTFVKDYLNESIKKYN